MSSLNRVLTPKEQWFLIGLTLAVAIGAVSLYMHDLLNLSHEALSETHLKSGGTHSDSTPSPHVERMNINTAAQSELERLPDIGPKLAAAIVRCRADGLFTSVDDLARVHGIGAKTVERLRSLVCVK